MFWAIFAVVEIVWLVGISIWIVLERRSSTATLAWILCLAALPGLGIVVYYFVGPRRLHRRKIRHALSRRAVAEWTKEHVTSPVTKVLSDPRHTRVARVGRRLGEARAVRVRELDFYFEGEPCFERLFSDIAAAKHHVHLQYYIVTEGKLGTRLRELLIDRAKAGVEVRVLMDGVGSQPLSNRFFDPLIEAGGEVAYFHPLRLARLRPRLLNFRNHRKIAIIDGKFGWTGGMNVMDEYLPGRKTEAWRDAHLRMTGRGASQLQLVFLEDWLDATGGGPSEPEYLALDAPSVTGTVVQVLASGPDQDIHPIHQALFALLSEARERVFAISPYFVPDEALLAALGAAALRGVDVKLLVPRRSDLRIVDAAGRSYHQELIGLGVKIHLYDPGMLHAKTIVVDHDLAMVGTANLDNRSLKLNFEVGVVLFDEKANRTLAEHFEASLAHATEVLDPAGRRLVPRLMEGFARLFSPIL